MSMDAFERREQQTRLAVMRRSLDLAIAELLFLVSLDDSMTSEISEDEYVDINEALAKLRTIRENT